MSITGKGVFAYSFAGPSIDARHTEEYKIHSLYKQGDRFVEGGKLAITETVKGITCTYTNAYHFANEQIIFDRTVQSCS